MHKVETMDLPGRKRVMVSRATPSGPIARYRDLPADADEQSVRHVVAALKRNLATRATERTR